MIQPISSLVSSATQAASVQKAPAIQQPESGAPARQQKPLVDEYVPEEKQEPSGRYYLGKDEEGQPKVYFDDPEQSAGAGGLEPKNSEGEKAELCTSNTDQVDREIEQLKKEKEQLEQQLNSQSDETQRQQLEAKLAQVESELSQKDNDTYRRQHAVFSFTEV